MKFPDHINKALDEDWQRIVASREPTLSNHLAWISIIRIPRSPSESIYVLCVVEMDSRFVTAYEEGKDVVASEVAHHYNRVDVKNRAELESLVAEFISDESELTIYTASYPYRYPTG